MAWGPFNAGGGGGVVDPCADAIDQEKARRSFCRRLILKGRSTQKPCESGVFCC